MKKLLSLLGGIAIAALSISSALAATQRELLDQLDFNKPKDGKLSSVELKAGLIHNLRKQRGSGHTTLLDGYQKAADKKGGVLALADLGLKDDEAFALQILYGDLQRRKGLSGDGPFAIGSFDPRADFNLFEIYDVLPTKAELKQTELVETKPKVILRRNAAGRTAVPKESEVAEQKKGALLAFSRNNEASTDQWLARGSLIWMRGKKINPDFTGKRSRLWAEDCYVYTALDKIDTGGGDAMEVDSLSFGGGFSRTWLMDDPLHSDGFEAPTAAERIRNRGASGQRLGINYFKVDGRIDYNTDTDFSHQIIGGEVDLVPTMTRIGLNNPTDFDGKLPFGFGWNLQGRLGGGNVFDAGGMEKLIEEGYARVGGKAGVGLYFPKREIAPGVTAWSMALEASYLHHETFGSDLDSPSYFEAEFRWRLTEALQFSAHLTVNYRKGTLEKNPSGRRYGDCGFLSRILGRSRHRLYTPRSRFTLPTMADLPQVPNDNTLGHEGPTLLNFRIGYPKFDVGMNGPGLLFNALELRTSLHLQDGCDYAAHRRLIEGFKVTAFCGHLPPGEVSIRVVGSTLAAYVSIDAGPPSMYMSHLRFETLAGETFQELCDRTLNPFGRKDYLVAMVPIFNEGVGHGGHHSHSHDRAVIASAAGERNVIRPMYRIERVLNKKRTND